MMWMGDWLSGRASRLHRGGRRFESVIAHHRFFIMVIASLAFFLVGCSGKEGEPERPVVDCGLH